MIGPVLQPTNDLNSDDSVHNSISIRPAHDPQPHMGKARLQLTDPGHCDCAMRAYCQPLQHTMAYIVATAPPLAPFFSHL